MKYGLALVLCVVAAGEALAQARAPSAARGRELYMTVGCAPCHGTEGQGSNAGLKLAPDPLPAEAIAQFIRAPNTNMPPYSEAVLSDADVADIAAYLATIPASKPVARIPLLNALKPGN